MLSLLFFNLEKNNNNDRKLPNALGVCVQLFSSNLSYL